MYSEMMCGHCDSIYTVDSDEESAVWMMVQRFAHAHAECGYMAPLLNADQEMSGKKIIKPRLTGGTEEA